MFVWRVILVNIIKMFCKLFKKASKFDDPTYVPDWIRCDFKTMCCNTYDIYGNVLQNELTQVVTEYGKLISIDNVHWKA